MRESLITRISAPISIQNYIHVAVTILIAINLRSDPQVQAKTLSPSPQSLQMVIKSQQSPRPYDESKSRGEKLKRTPESMQHAPGHSIRRFMWSEIEDTLGGIMHDMSEGARTLKHMISGEQQREPFRPYNLYQPAASTVVKYIVRKPIINHQPIYKLPQIKPLNPFSIHYNYPNTLALTATQETFKMFEDLAVREWLTHNKDTGDFLPSVTTASSADQNITITDFEQPLQDWQPVTMQPAQVVSNLYTDVRPFYQTIKKGTVYDVTENAAEETIQRPRRVKQFGKKSIKNLADNNMDSYNYPEWFKNKTDTDNDKHISKMATTTTPSTPIAEPIGIEKNSNGERKNRKKNFKEIIRSSLTSPGLQRGQKSLETNY